MSVVSMKVPIFTRNMNWATLWEADAIWKSWMGFGWDYWRSRTVLVFYRLLSRLVHLYGCSWPLSIDLLYSSVEKALTYPTAFFCPLSDRIPIPEASRGHFLLFPRAIDTAKLWPSSALSGLTLLRRAGIYTVWQWLNITDWWIWLKMMSDILHQNLWNGWYPPLVS